MKRAWNIAAEVTELAVFAAGTVGLVLAALALL
jgi:hypothetical protein